MNNIELEAGSWINTNFGPAVVTEVSGEHVSFRYEAVRMVDDEIIYVLNGDTRDAVTFLKKPDAKGLMIATLTGPYGED